MNVGDPLLPWTRRANVLVEAVQLPRAKGGIIAVGPVGLEVTARPIPAARPGLLQR